MFAGPTLWLLVVLGLIFSIQTTNARSCSSDMLIRKSSDGEILFMISGAIFEVDPGDSIDSLLWLPPADVVVCETSVKYQERIVVLYDIINMDENGEKVGARRLRQTNIGDDRRS
jgi:hypothetical protein